MAFHYADPLARIIVHNLHLDADVAAMEARHRTEMIRLAERVMALGQRRGEIPADRDPAFVAAMMIGGMREVLGVALSGEQWPDQEDHRRQAVDARRGRGRCRPRLTPHRRGASWRQDDAAAMRDRLRAGRPTTLGPDAEVDGLERLPGHSGITWAFDLGTATGPSGWSCACRRWGRAAAPRTTCTDRPRCSPRSPSTACRRRGCGGAASDGPWFGTPYLIVDRVAGAPPGDVFAAGGAPAPARAVFAEAMRVLPHIHATPPPSDWRPATPLAAVVDHWRRLLEETPEPSWIPAGRALHAGLRAAVPDGRPARSGARATTTPTTGWWPTASSSPCSTGRALTAATAGSTSAGSR